MRCLPLVAAALLLAACESSYRDRDEAAAPSTTAACPVSGKPARSDISLVHEGETVRFCSEECRKSFEESPEQFTARRATPARGEGRGAPRRVEGSGAR